MKKNTFAMSMGLLGMLTFASMLLPKHADAVDFSYLSYLLRIKYLSSLSYSLPARDLNGTFLNGRYLEDRFVTAVSLDNVRMGNGKVTSLKLSGTAFNHGGQIEGAEFTGTLDDGSLLTLRVDAVTKVSAKAESDVLRYAVSYASDEGWKPLCGSDADGNPVKAVPLEGVWDYTAGTASGGSHIEDDRLFTFACEGFVLEKCVEAGYKPWGRVFACTDKGSCEWISLAPYHQACTRMLRADYCGDGSSYTMNNVLVALYDGLGIRVDTEDWEPEAEWDEDGAVCSASHRIESLVPACGESLVDETCGDKSHFQDGVLIMSELPN